MVDFDKVDDIAKALHELNDNDLIFVISELIKRRNYNGIEIDQFLNKLANKIYYGR